MSSYDYPILSGDEIISTLDELQISSITIQHLLHPATEVITRLYASIVLHIEDASQADDDQLEFSSLELLEHPDAHVDSVRCINLLDKVRQLLAAINCPEPFTLNDLVRPDSDRTYFFMSIILNFVLFRESKLRNIQPLVHNIQLIDERCQALEARLSQLNAEISAGNQSREMEMPIIQQIDSQVKELRQTISDLNNHQMSLKATIKKQKERVKEMDEKISSEDFALVQAVHHNANLQSNIVQSPDKLQRALDEKKSFLVETRNAERAAMQSFQDKTAMREVYTKACNKLSRHISQMQAIQEQVNSCKSIEKEVKALKLKMNDEDVADRSLESKLVEMQGRANQVDELKLQFEKERDVSHDEAAKELKSVELEMESKKQGLETRQKALEGVIAEAAAITAEMHSVRESGASKCQELFHKCEEVVAALQRYSKKIKVALPTTH